MSSWCLVMNKFVLVLVFLNNEYYYLYKFITRYNYCCVLVCIIIYLDVLTCSCTYSFLYMSRCAVNQYYRNHFHVLPLFMFHVEIITFVAWGTENFLEPQFLLTTRKSPFAFMKTNWRWCRKNIHLLQVYVGLFPYLIGMLDTYGISKYLSQKLPLYKIN